MKSIKSVIVDTGYIVALFHEEDQANQAAVNLEAELGDGYQFVTTFFVIQEICWLLKKRVGYKTVLQFMDCLSDGYIKLPPLPDHWIQKTYTVLNKYADREIDLADASIVVLADHLNLGDVATVDRKDFSVLRWGNGKKRFNNLLLAN